MPQEANSGHVYNRTLDASARTSLSVIASLIPDGATVLDLGSGSGALGAYLAQTKGCTVDGLTYNAQEAELARPHYRSVEVANLETCDLLALMGNRRYEAIVCADVLEHIRNPDQVLAACRGLLNSNGQVILSIPNAAYGGLIAELLAGEFRYRDEGLLDRTHVRFYTRSSLLQLVRDNGLQVDALELIERPLPESEFATNIDALPPAVGRYLVSAPDALVYQFVLCCRPGNNNFDDQAVQAATSQAEFTAQLYVQRAGAWSEDAKLTRRGTIGLQRQTLTFALTATVDSVSGLRLDPADRPGYLYLYSMTLRADDQAVWRWSHDEADAMRTLESSVHGDIVFCPTWPGAGARALLMTGADPRFELPLSATVLAACRTAQNCVLDVELGWPMSADYLSAASLINPMLDQLCEVREQLEREQRVHSEILQDLRTEHAREQDAAVQRVMQMVKDDLGAHRQWQRTLDEHTELSANLRMQTQQLTRQNELLHAQLAQDAERARQEREQDAERAQQELAQSVARESALTEAIAIAQDQLSGRNAAIAQLTQRIEHAKSETEQLRGDIEARRVSEAELRSELDKRATQLAMLRSELLRTRDARDAAAAHIDWLKQSTVFRMTRPLIRAKMWLQGSPSNAATPQMITQHSGSGPAPQPTSGTVDVIVPVYKGLFDTQRCVTSALHSVNHTPMRMVIINDCSPDPEVTRWLREIAKQDSRITLLENEVNLGFVGTVNRGMSFGPANDVVLLNSDTEVANDWLDRLRRAAYCDARGGTVTPFSNNATICSYPKFCEENTLPEGYDTARLDHLFAQANPGEVVDVPTGVGFCMYIRRDCLDQVGLFDVANFGRGYGEENDFCRRAAGAGWRNLHALDTFVLHAGGVSFGNEKNERVMAAMQTLARLYPDYEPMVHAFIAQDPAAPARHKVDLALAAGVMNAEQLQSDARIAVLLVVHDRTGGTLRHVHELAQHLADTGRFYTLTPTGGGRVTLRQLDAQSALALEFSLPDEQEDLNHALRGLGIALVHYHHWLGHRDDVRELPARLGIPYDVTAHDYYAFCPQISLTDASNRYCGEEGVAQCTRCLSQCPAPGGVSIEQWRAQTHAFLLQARHVYAPSHDAAQRVERYLGRAVVVAPHTDLSAEQLATPGRPPRQLSSGEALRIAVIGALSPIKGADVLEDVAVLAGQRGAALEFHLIGYAYRHLKGAPNTPLTVHGAYEEDQLSGWLDRIQPDVLWFPAQWPETYSYTLSAAIASGLPIVATGLGAHAERLAGRAASWIEAWNASPEQWVSFFDGLRTTEFALPMGRSTRTEIAAPNAAAATTAPLWSYRSQYFAGLQRANEVPGIAQDFVLAHLPGRRHKNLSHRANDKTKGLLLHIVQNMRTRPAFSRLARAMPLRWQTRVKSWLLG